MKAGLMILGITAFLVVNTYYDGKYTKMLSINQKYFKMAMFAFVGFSMYLLIKKNPKGSKSMLQHANALIRYMPVDRETADLISPIFDFRKLLISTTYFYFQRVYHVRIGLILIKYIPTFI